MKHRLTALVALAAFVAAPAVASAATMHDPAMTSQTPTSRTMVIVPTNSDPSQALFAADQTYLTSLCPNVLSHPGNYTSAYKQFCQVKPS